MEGVKRGRGRPSGDKYDDSKALMMVARRVAGDPPLKATTAMRMVRDGGTWEAASDDALIRRWQEKWRKTRAVYLQGVADERAEAERQQRERAAAHAREMSRKSWWEMTAELREAGHISGFTKGNELREFFNRHDQRMESLSGWRALAGRVLPKTDLNAFEAYAAFADAKRYGIAGGEALKSAMGVWDNPDLHEAMRRTSMMGLAGAAGALDKSVLGDTLQKWSAVGRTMAEAGTFPQVPKLPKWF